MPTYIEIFSESNGSHKILLRYRVWQLTISGLFDTYQMHICKHQSSKDENICEKKHQRPLDKKIDWVHTFY